MKLSHYFKSAAFKYLVTVDLPGRGSNQHELNGVAALKTFFETESKVQGTLNWHYFSDSESKVEEEGDFTFYDARARSANVTGRSEWRFYYSGNFLRNAAVGDLFVFVRSIDRKYHALVFKKGSTIFEFARSLLSIDSSALKFDNISSNALSKVHDNQGVSNKLVDWLVAINPEATAHPNAPAQERVEKLPFKPRSRMLMLLGDQLIRDPGIAIFELVKNSYDADATYANVTLLEIEERTKGTVIVEDDGCGMDWDQVIGVWLEPGTDYRQQQKSKGERSPRFNRLPLGEKGIGRFAAHKLGRQIQLITRKSGANEIVVNIDWTEFESEKYLEDARVNVTERSPKHFVGNSTGTRIEVTDLNEDLTRGTVRQIHRSVTSISSPFREPSEFLAKLEIIPDNNLASGLLDVSKVIEISPYRASCIISEDALTYDYEFIPPDSLHRIAGRKVDGRVMNIPPFDLFSHGSLQSKVGSIFIEFRIYDLDTQFLELSSVSDKKGLKDFLKTNGGIRVYRDGVRVYDYGEPGNDWLNLGGSRVNNPTARVSNNQIIGAIHLDGATSASLIEKTNREGFIEDHTYELFRGAVQFALTQIVQERNTDKKRLREIYSKTKRKQPVLSELAELRSAIKKIPEYTEELGGLVDSVESKFVEMRDTLMTAAGAGLTLSVVIHEVGNAIRNLVKAVERDCPISELRDQAIHLDELIEGLTYLTRKSGRKSELMSSIIMQSLRNTAYRTRVHKITVFNGIENGDEDFSAVCTKRLIIATVMNLFDNSIYWLSTKNESDCRIYIGTTKDIKGGPVLFVADNGPGFSDEPEMLTQPFMSRKPDGMGLGLHVASTVMESQGGKIIFPSRDDIGLPETYCGAIVGLQFNSEK